MRPSKISKELTGAIAEEQRRHAIDAAKKKAVAQHADYDTFKKMVSVAHLKPLQAQGSQGAADCALPAWRIDPTAALLSSTSSTCSPPCEQEHAETDAALSDAVAALPITPCSSLEFAREFKRTCPTAKHKYRLIQQCGAEGLARIFKVEINSIMLGQVLQVIQQEWQQPQSWQNHDHQTAVNNTLCKEEESFSAQKPAALEQKSQGQWPRSQTSSTRFASGGGSAVLSDPPDNAMLHKAMQVVRLLEALAGAGRFDLNVRLLDKTSKAAAADLCGQLLNVLQKSTAQCAACSSNVTCSSSSTNGGDQGSTLHCHCGQSVNQLPHQQRQQQQLCSICCKLEGQLGDAVSDLLSVMQRMRV